MKDDSFIKSYTMHREADYCENIFNSSVSRGISILYESIIGGLVPVTSAGFRSRYRSLDRQRTQTIFCKSDYLENISMRSMRAY